MLSGTVWPAHPRPLPSEALSSWFIRCAHANGMKAQTFAVRNFGHQRQLWNRDIDRFAPDWLLQTMSERTGTPLVQVKKMTALLFGGRLFQSKNLSGQLRWWLPLNMYHRTYRNFGIQYCPQCLAEDAIPYFRLGWRLAFYTFCPKHQIMLHDRCHHCQQPVAFHRVGCAQHPIPGKNAHPQMLSPQWETHVSLGVYASAPTSVLMCCS